MTGRAPAQPPAAGWRRMIARAPVQLYRWHLGPLLGRRICLLTHTGRTSGLPRRTALEVTGTDPATGAVHLASGFGPASQWYRNIQHTPKVTVQSGRRHWTGTARPMTPDESGRAMAAYAPLHPRTARTLMRICGLTTDGSTEDWYRIGHDHIPFVEITPDPRTE